MIPSWILELVGFAAAHASDDHGATCPAHADPAAECLCGLSEAEAVLANVPEAVKGVALRAVPVAFDCHADRDPLPDRLVKPMEAVRIRLNAAAALGVVPPDMAEMIMSAVTVVALDLFEEGDRIDGILGLLEYGLRKRTLRKAVLLDGGSGFTVHIRMSGPVDRSELSDASIEVLDQIECFAGPVVGEA